MLRLENVTKNYITATETVAALRGVSLSFRKNEFVSILGPSGCGKTTLLNLIGGLDRYTTGNLYIGGVVGVQDGAEEGASSSTTPPAYNGTYADLFVGDFVGLSGQADFLPIFKQ